MKGNEGDQRYGIPAGTDVEHYNTVTIYCERFRGVFGSGALRKF